MLFDLSKDIGESTDLAVQLPDVTQRLDRALEAYLTEVEAKRPTTNQDYDPDKDPGRQRGGMRGGPRTRRPEQ